MSGDADGRGAIRAFLAFEIPEALKRRLVVEQARLRTLLPPARWVRPAGLHLTMKFLGETRQERLDALLERLRPRLDGAPAVRVAIAGGGFFPSPERPRVAWLGGTAEGGVRVVEAVEAAAEGAGFARERRRWALHLTQARLRRGWPAPAVEIFLEWAQTVRLKPFTCRELILFQSSLQPGGAVYTPLERIGLR